MDRLLQVTTLWLREMTRFRRQPTRVVGVLLEPLVFWLFLGIGLKASFKPAGMSAQMNYFEYFYPGIVMLGLLFAAIFSTITTIEDRKQGFLQGVLTSPISRVTVVMGQALGASSIALVEGIVFLCLAPLAGIHLTAAAVAASIAIMALIAFALTSIGLIIAWNIESTQGFHAIMNPVLIPLWMLSGAFFPATGAPSWLGWTMWLNPLTYGMNALRKALYLGESASFYTPAQFRYSLAISIGFAAVVFWLATAAARRSSAA